MKLTLLASLALGVQAATPVSKVTQLLQDLITQTEEEGEQEKKVYDKYSCFCKDTTDDKSKNILDLESKIEQEAANLGKGRADKAQAIADYEEATKELGELANELAEKTATFNKELAAVESVILDLEKANSSLDKAIDAVDKSKTRATLLAVTSTLKKHLMVAEVLGLGDKVKHVQAFLQGAGDDKMPGEESYDFKSDGIMEILGNLKTEFAEKLADSQEEKSKLVNAHEEFKASNKEATEAATEDQTNAETARADAQEDIGDATKALTTHKSDLEDDQLYLTDLTASCELKGRTYDQRSTMRTKELGALNKALEIIKGSVTTQDTVNKRAFLNQKSAKVTLATRKSNFSMDDDVISFVQKTKVSLLASTRAARVHAVLDEVADQARSLKSVILLQNVLSMKAGPFDKVKNLIQALIERLTKEATEEATQKGYCDTEMGKAKKQRDFRRNDVDKLNGEMQKMLADKAQNKMDVEQLTEELDALNEDLQKATENRKDEKESNLDTLDKAKEGLDAVSMAIDVLQKFYKGEYGVGGANSASVSFVQVASKESPILADEEALGDVPQSGEAYQGNQAGGDNVIALLSIIKSDYERTVRVTTEDEKAAAADFIKFERQTKVSIMSKETEKKNKSNTVKVLTSKIASGFDDLESNVQMMDDQVKILQELNPLCVDTGMTFAERKAKRQAEIDALNKALEQLAPPGP